MSQPPKPDDDFDAFVDDVLKSGDGPPLLTTPSDVRPDRTPSEYYATVLLSSTAEIPGRTIVGHHGLVAGQCVTGQGAWKNLKMALSDSFGRRSKTMEDELQRMQQECFRQLKMSAYQKGANAVVGVSVQVGEMSGEADMFFVAALGTAVKTQ